MACDPQSLLTAGKCFQAMASDMRLADALQLWCDISGNITPVGPSTNPPLLSSDGHWYVVSAVDLGGGDGTISVDQVAVPPGVHPYLVIQRPTDGLLYKLGLIGSPDSVFWFIDDTPLAESEIPTVLTDGFTNWDLTIGVDFNARLISI